VDREQAIEQLPETHAAAIRLRARGYDDDAIATALALSREAIPPLLRLADDKLAALTRAQEPPSERKRKGRRR
jgi:DNA-directed RNA polymerase specialized sigma24 family protein